MRALLTRLTLALVLVGFAGCSAEPTVRTEPKKDSPPRFPARDQGKK